MDKPNLRRSEASVYLKEKYGVTLAPATLARLACVGGGPAFRKDGKYPLYTIAELDHFALARLGPVRRSSSEIVKGRAR